MNDPLSLDRATATLAYLEDDVETWLGFYGSRMSDSQRWGKNEDELMRGALQSAAQTLPEDATRANLIRAYMTLDGAELDSGEFKIKARAHGCGENFPVDNSGENLDKGPENDQEDASDRRVELFFFDVEFGIQPPPSGKHSGPGSAAYPLWRKKVTDLVGLQSSFVEGLVVEWHTELDSIVSEDLVLKASEDGQTQRLAWTDGFIDGEFRRFIFRRIRGTSPVTLVAESATQEVELTLWQDQVVNDPNNPPIWQHLLEEIDPDAKPDEGTEADLQVGAEVPAISDANLRPGADAEFA